MSYEKDTVRPLKLWNRKATVRLKLSFIIASVNPKNINSVRFATF